MNDRVTFAVDKYELLNDSENEQLAKLKLFICNSERNLHNLPISWDSILLAKNSLIGKPVLTHYLPYREDFGSHDVGEEIPVGVFLNESDISEETDSDGVNWLTAISYLWKFYFPDVYDVLEKRNGSPVSMEISVLDGTKDKDGKFDSVNLFSFNGVTLLGSKVQPAIPNARATLDFAAMVEETKQLLKYSYNHIDFHIPQNVKSNSQKGLELYSENKKGGNSYNLAMARYLTKNTSIESDRVKKLHQSLQSKSKQDLSKDGDNYISFMLLGGKAGLDWCQGLMNEMDKTDNAKLSHFAKEDDEMDMAKSDEYGTGSAIKVDKSAKSMSTSAWGDVDKIALRNKVLKASNYKSLVNDVYMVVEAGWEDSPSSKLGYPVMQIIGDKAVYNRYGLANALTRAEGQNESGVVSKINGIYKSLGIEDNENKSKEEKSSMAKEMKEGSPEEEKQETPEEEKKEDMAAPEKEKMAKKPAEGSPEEEKEETPAEEEKEKKEGKDNPAEEKKEKKMAAGDNSDAEDESPEDKENAKMSLDSYADVGAMMAMLGMETEKNQSLAKESVSPEMGNLFAKAFAKVQELNKFKADVEDEKMAYEVEKTMAEVSDMMPMAKKEELKAEASKFSLATIDGWKNKVKATAFEFSKDNEKKTDGITRMALPFQGKQNKTNDSLWSGR